MKDIIKEIKKGDLLKEMPMDFDGQDRPHPDYEDILNRQETPFKKVPFPQTGRQDQNFQELLGSESFREVIQKYKQYNNDDSPINQGSMMNLYRKQASVLEQIYRLEEPHREELSNLAVELVKKQFSIPEGVLNFDAKIVGNPNEISKEGFENDQPNEENPEAPNIDDEPMFNTIDLPETDLQKLEKAKRRLVNATLQGAARVGQYMFHMVENEIANIVGNNNAPSLYGQMMSMNDLNYWLFPEQLVKQSSEQGPMAGRQDVERGDDENGGIPTIHAIGINFPTLVHELIKGLLEVFALKRDDENGEEYDMVKGEDTITKESWDLRLGVAIWKRLKNVVPMELNLEEKQELQNYLLNHIFNLPAKQYLNLMREVMGQTEKGKRAIENIVKDMEDIYNDVNDNVYKDDNDFENYDEDGYFIGDVDNEEDFPEEIPTQQKTNKLPKTDVDFDYEKDNWRLNETKRKRKLK